MEWPLMNATLGRRERHGNSDRGAAPGDAGVGTEGSVEFITKANRDDPPWADHRSRYHFAGRFVQGSTVVDVACGSGYGGPILVKAGAGSVIGIDASEEALRHAAAETGPLFSVLQADARQLPFDRGSVGVVTSFETIEHVDDCEAFLGEIRRVLADDGVALISSPNAVHTRPLEGVPRNPFHVREFEPEEFARLLVQHFGEVTLLGQRVTKRFRPCPYWERDEVTRAHVWSRTKALLWKALVRLPRPAGDTAARIFLGHRLFPGEHDFTFTRQDVCAGHVLLAVCRP
jgi:2-polyprenyl-3-methyl-5-hydroxy-6-metoxy-1,4-benzoquinol methylase